MVGDFNFVSCFCELIYNVEYLYLLFLQKIIFFVGLQVQELNASDAEAAEYILNAINIADAVSLNFLSF